MKNPKNGVLVKFKDIINKILKRLSVLTAKALCIGYDQLAQKIAHLVQQTVKKTLLSKF
jgi:hypothetical protein